MHTQVEARKVAKGGFYHTGTDANEVECSWCGCRISDWEYGDQVRLETGQIPPILSPNIGPCSAKSTDHSQKSPPRRLYLFVEHLPLRSNWVTRPVVTGLPFSTRSNTVHIHCRSPCTPFDYAREFSKSILALQTCVFESLPLTLVQPLSLVRVSFLIPSQVMARHRSESPDCPFILNKSNNVPLIHNMNTSGGNGGGNDSLQVRVLCIYQGVYEEVVFITTRMIPTSFFSL